MPAILRVNFTTVDKDAHIAAATTTATEVQAAHLHAHHLLVGGHDYEAMLGRLEGAGLEVFEVRDFRDTDTALPVPLTGETRRRFVDPALWTQAQIDRERLILATRPGTFRP